MRILIAHNSHKIAGGEQRVFESESRLLASAGHDVFHFNVHNDQIDSLGTLSLARKTIYNRESSDQLSKLIDRHQPEIVHVHNILPLLSPSIFRAAKRHGVPTIWTLHNYRLICPGMYLLRDGKTCEQCVSKRLAMPAIVHKCYRGSRSATTAVAAMQLVHRTMGTWKKNVDRFITPSKFTKRKFVDGGMSPEKITVKGNFVPGSPQMGTGDRDGIVYVGRLSEEKGIQVLLDAWTQHHLETPLRIVGGGPMEDQVRKAAEQFPQIEFLGSKTSDAVSHCMSQATATIVPSLCYETFGMVVAESMSVGTPVIASDGGALAELIRDEKNGLLMQPGSASAAAQAVKKLLQMDQSMLQQEARRSYEKLHTEKANLHQLQAIYEDVIASANSPTA